MFKTMLLAFLLFAALAAVVSERLLAEQGSLPGERSAEDAKFKPVVEAPLPEGFPTYTPVGAVEVKRYPAYRKAESAGGAAFWTLFEHITTGGISMTAPVEMTYSESGPPLGRERSMAFLYGKQSIGSAGEQGKVRVIDVPPATVVSIGVRGQRTDAALVQAEQRLRNWLDENKIRFQQSGPVRVMGYNSPFVPRDRQFYEVQIPIAEKPREGLGDPAP